jgi:dodecin
VPSPAFQIVRRQKIFLVKGWGSAVRWFLAYWRRTFVHYPIQIEEFSMTVAKIIEISAQSSKSFEDACQAGIARANETIKGISGAWIAEQKVVVEKGKVTGYRVTMKVSFLLEEAKPKSKK